jgi:hypothetical protein
MSKENGRLSKDVMFSNVAYNYWERCKFLPIRIDSFDQQWQLTGQNSASQTVISAFCFNLWDA